MIMGWEENDSNGYVEEKYTTIPWTDSPEDEHLESLGLCSQVCVDVEKKLNSPIEVTIVIPKMTRWFD